jgi:hypothetical protein
LQGASRALTALLIKRLTVEAVRGLLGGVKAGEAPRLRVALMPFSKSSQNRDALCVQHSLHQSAS